MKIRARGTDSCSSNEYDNVVSNDSKMAVTIMMTGQMIVVHYCAVVGQISDCSDGFLMVTMILVILVMVLVLL